VIHICFYNSSISLFFFLLSLFDNSELIIIVKEQQIKRQTELMNFRSDFQMMETNLIYSSQDDISYADQQSNSSYKCSICHRIFRDPVVTQCGVSNQC
jgi:hypothetical protein